MAHISVLRPGTKEILCESRDFFKFGIRVNAKFNTSRYNSVFLTLMRQLHVSLKRLSSPYYCLLVYEVCQLHLEDLFICTSL
jgi:hypothetical protein